VEPLLLPEKRSSQARRCILGLPFSRRRATVGADGGLALLDGPSIRFDARPSRIQLSLPFAEWRWARDRLAFNARACVTDRGAFMSLEIENRYSEVREVKLRAEVGLPEEIGDVHLSGTVLCASDGAALVSVHGAQTVALARGSKRLRRLDISLPVPSRHTRLIEVALHVAGRRLSRRAVVAEQSEVGGIWDDSEDEVASVHLPDETLLAAHRRSWSAVIGSIAPDERGDWPWPRTGAPPKVGPGTLEALALHALDAWGARQTARHCIESVFNHQGTFAPPGDSFLTAAGLLAPPLGDPVRARWGSDCGALLWAASSRFGHEFQREYLRAARGPLEKACAWIEAEIARDGVLPEARSPKLPGLGGRAWNDAWTWRGLSAAAETLAKLSQKTGERLADVADAYRDRIVERWGADVGALTSLVALSLLPRADDPTSRPRMQLRTLHEHARLLAEKYPEGIDELSASSSYLLTLRRVLLDDESDGPLRVFPGALREWFGAGQRLEFNGLPTARGAVTARSFGAGDRTLVDLVLPKGVDGAVLCVGASSSREFSEVRVNGRRWKSARIRGGAIQVSGDGEHVVEILWGRPR
jgi:hypothetical protein